MANCRLTGEANGTKACEVCGRTTSIVGAPESIKMRCGVVPGSGPAIALSKEFSQRPAAPQVAPMSPWEKAKSFGRSMAAFAADGCALVDSAEYDRRLAICDSCENRASTACKICGCRLSIKARGRAFACPIGKW